MKKILAVLLCAMLVSASAVTVSAYDSPVINPDSDTDSAGTGTDDDSSKPKPTTDTDKTSSDTDKGSSSKAASSNPSSTSPKTGAPISYGVLMAAAALAFGTVALASKKKTEE